MKLTVLGMSSAYPGPGTACSGYLIEEGSTKLLIDCGTGVLSNLLKVVALTDIMNIVISHLHPDHFFDLIPYRHAMVRPTNNNHRPRLYLPPQGIEKLLDLISMFDSSPISFSEFFELEEYDPSSLLKLGDLSMKFASVKHYIPCYAMVINGNRRVVYSADSGVCDELAAIAQGADLFLCEATRCETDNAEWGHLSADEAASLAKRVKVKRLVLTHFRPDCDYSQDLEQARTTFGEALEIATEFNIYEL